MTMTHSSHITDLHLTSIFLVLVLFVLAIIWGGTKRGRIVHMILRLLYLVTVGTGIQLLFSIGKIPFDYVSKTVLGILVIGFMEIILVRRKKGDSARLVWILFILCILVTIYVGLSMPIGFFLN